MAVLLLFSEMFFQDLFSIGRSILVQLSSSFVFIPLLSVEVVHPYISMDTTDVWKKIVLYFIALV